MVRNYCEFILLQTNPQMIKNKIPCVLLENKTALGHDSFRGFLSD